MPPAKLTGILTVLIPEIIAKIIAQNNISEYQAMEQFYQSKLYSLLSAEKTGLWHYSASKLAEMFFTEKASGQIEFPEESA
ncbi:hypothetical protein NO1_1583 [Candidatus Termititenax aidoneus]|uniref:Uncharacterized protein n=1 Tax=Termititenax aidoneus TaxID=2218524 RepID=A0A388TC51_TERA1|nr:hypothetical protein NO1_1583 [Candidatus Termititenax aidoneus]